MADEPISIARSLFGRETPAEAEHTEPTEQAVVIDAEKSFAAKLFANQDD